MRTKISPELIERYLKNRCDEEEVRLLHDWYASFEDIPEPVESLSPAQQKELKERMLKGIQNNLRYSSSVQAKASGSTLLAKFYSAALIAATVVLVFSVVRYFLPENGSPDKKVAAVKSAVTYNNDSGKLMNFVLPDGSSLWLKPNTKISYLHTPGSKYREVRLEGECFFDVRDDASHPFVVYTGKLKTQVLGTSFNIKSGSNTGAAEVSVVTGKVFVFVPQKGSSGTKGVVLLPKQKAVYANLANHIVRATETSPSLRIWQKRSISFENETVGNVVKVLNANFNVNIVIEDPVISGYTLKADFTGQNLPEILEMISRSLDVSCEITNDNIHIKSI